MENFPKSILNSFTKMQLHVSSSDIECVYIIIKIIKNGDQKKIVKMVKPGIILKVYTTFNRVKIF